MATGHHVPFAHYRPLLEAARDAMVEQTRHIPGCTVEDNIYSVSVHYRNVEAARISEVEHIVRDYISMPSPQQHRQQQPQPPQVGQQDTPMALEVRPGKMVWELRPAEQWSKGHAATFLLRQVFHVGHQRQQREQQDQGQQQGHAGLGSGPLQPGQAPASASVGGSGRSNAGITVVCIGDDHTDEDMFNAILSAETEGIISNAIPIIVSQPVVDAAGGQATTATMVGPDDAAQMPRHTAARFYLRSPDEVQQLLQMAL